MEVPSAGDGGPHGGPASARAAAGVEVGDRIGDRYAVEELIGRGGMARVYRAMDLVERRHVALKQAVLPADERNAKEAAALFEREFRTLAQLSHPRIVAVYDYGVDERGAFYTMELLDGGDLREMVPIPWQRACALSLDVCSSLALLHSRRLVHRDVSPRNVRCTRDHQAKLIDFGAMVPMSAGGLIVGTAQFMAPEVLHQSNVDARTDLFSLGATLYFTLTGRPPYPAKGLSDVAAAWATKPVPPSGYCPEVPPALDALVLSLLAPDAAERPRTAFDVMHRLTALPGVEWLEPASVEQAYLSTPTMVGRDEVMSALGVEASEAFAGRGKSVLVTGAIGLGASRVLDAAALHAKTIGFTVLRATKGAIGTERFRVAQRLADQLVEAIPTVAIDAARDEKTIESLFAPKADGEATSPRFAALGSSHISYFALQSALSDWFVAVSRQRPLALVVDDVHRIDEASASLLAIVASQAARHRLLLVTASEADATPTDAAAYGVLARHSRPVVLEPIARADTERLLESVFGDVPNLGVLTESVHGIARGNPGVSMDLVQHLVDRRVIRYQGGAWTLPHRLDATEVPRSAEEAIRVRIALLSPLARFLAESQALATYAGFTPADYERLRPEAPRTEIDRVLFELSTHNVITGDDALYTLTHRGYAAALLAPLTEAARTERHRALASMYEGRLDFGVIRHCLLGGIETRALDLLGPLIQGLPEATNLYELTSLSSSEIAATFDLALSAAERVGRSAHELNQLRRWLTSLSVGSDDAHYFRAAPAWLARLKVDSGYSDWEALSSEADPGARLSKAMGAAFARYAATPEAERAYRPDEAVKGLAHYVGISLAIGSSRLDLHITDSLPALLEPFRTIAPLIDAIWQNAVATRESSCKSQLETARQSWLSVHERLEQLEGADAFIGVFRRAVEYAIAANGATMGIPSAARWAERLDATPAQRINGMHLRRILRLQQGDTEGAERLRRQAEVAGLKARARQMFTHLHWVELVACGMARDLTGLKQVGDRIRVLAQRAPGWVPYVCLSEGFFHLACDAYEPAQKAFQKAVELTRPIAGEPVPSGWCIAVAGWLEALIGLDRIDEARTEGEHALRTCHELGIDVASHGVSRALALAEGRVGELEAAVARLEGIIRTQLGLGIAGLHLGATYEARARLAIWANDELGIAHYAALTAQEYRHGAGSPLGARYVRLMEEAARGGKDGVPTLAAAPFPDPDAPSHESLASAAALVSDVMHGATDTEERVARALGVLCRELRSAGGYFFLLEGDVLTCKAVRGSEMPPPRDLVSFVERFLRAGTADVDATAIMEADGATLSTETAFADHRGMLYCPVLIRGKASGSLRTVGVAALAAVTSSIPISESVTTALGSYLLESLRK